MPSIVIWPNCYSFGGNRMAYIVVVFITISEIYIVLTLALYAMKCFDNASGVCIHDLSKIKEKVINSFSYKGQCINK